MADYWKSYEKHYCDFCKCWTAGNKASIDFHERGKNHQANVKKKLSEIKKNQIDKRKKDEASKKMFQKMEKAALAAVQKDMTTGNESLGRSDMKNIVEAHADPTAKQSPSDSTYPWKKMVAPQGVTYYYNSLTGESTWKVPEVFKDLQHKNDKDKFDKEAAATLKNNDKKGLKKFKEQKNVPPVNEVHSIHPLLGGWSTVPQHHNSEEEKDESESLSKADHIKKEDEEKSNEQEIADDRQVGKKFKEKVMKTNLITPSDEQTTSFKKRKSVKRIVRKRDDD